MAEVEEILSFEDCSAVLPGKQKTLVCNEDQAVFAGLLVWWARLALHLVSEVGEDSNKMERDWQWAGGLHGKKGNHPQIAGMGRDAKTLTTNGCLPKRQVSRCFNLILYLC